MTLRARVFAKDGNRFLIPGYWCDEEAEDWQGMSMSSLMIDGMMLAVVCKMDSTAEWLDIETDADGRADLPHVPYELVGKQFVHGGIKVLMISGPLIDNATAKLAG